MSYKKSAFLQNKADQLKGKELLPLMYAVMKEAEFRYERKISCTVRGPLRLMMWQMLDEGTDVAMALFLNRQGRLISSEVLCRRGIRQWESYVKRILAQTESPFPQPKAFIVVHNHVNEPLIPSPDDLALTMLFQQVERLNFLGHYITDGFRIRKIEGASALEEARELEERALEK